ncbi:MAG TPA: cyclase family protein [Acidimicrobiales bacterium]|jgi:kynurenine formamidase|nr:cyclase family protein [Acidimicrobiales bacterium]
MGVPERFAEIAAQVRNWGRWGADDQLGTLNLVDDDARRRAAASVRTGQAIPLGLPLSEAEGIQMGFVPGRINPKRSMIAVNQPLSPDPDWICTNEDVVELALQCATHWDGLAHVSYGGQLYNGYPAGSVTEAGAARCGIHLVRTLVSRGVLLDVARARGQAVLDPGHPISPGDLDAALELAGVDLAPGDVVLVRTGQMVHLALPSRPAADGGPPGRDLVAYTWPTPGLTMATAAWFGERDVAAVATDTLPLEVFPGEDEDIYLPVHLLHLVEMGMTQGQNWVLDDLADACAADGRYDFFLDATPLPFTGGLGSPLNPVAVR